MPWAEPGAALKWYAVLSLPLLFAGGMTLFDTADGCFMNFAYGWAFARPCVGMLTMTVTGILFLSCYVSWTLAAVGELGPRGARMVAFFGCMHYAALRPEEATDLRRANLIDLPDHEWGENAPDQFPAA